MKKIFCVIIMIFIINEITNAEDYEDDIEFIINTCIRFLGNPVPNRFEKIDDTTYVLKATESSSFNLKVEDGIVKISDITIIGNRRYIRDFYIAFINYFRKNDWEYLIREENGLNIFFKNEIYACVSQPIRRNDGKFNILIAFMNDMEHNL